MNYDKFNMANEQEVIDKLATKFLGMFFIAM
jgi:hypothetical protein